MKYFKGSTSIPFVHMDAPLEFHSIAGRKMQSHAYDSLTGLGFRVGRTGQQGLSLVKT